MRLLLVLVSRKAVNCLPAYADFCKKTAPQSAFAASLRRLKANFQYENTQWVLCRCHGQRPLSLFGFSGAAKGILRVIAQTLQPAVNHVVQAVFRKAALFQSATD